MKKIPSRHLKDDVSIVLGAEAGRGVQSMEFVLTHVLKRAGYHVFGTKEYMSRVRGGSNSTEIRVSSSRVAAFVNRIDILIPLDRGAISHLEHRISPDTIILGQREELDTSHPIVDIPFTELAREIGNAIYANTIAVGVVLGLLKVDAAVLDAYLTEFFARKSQAIIDGNVKSGRRGYEIGLSLGGPEKIDIEIKPCPEVQNELFLNGAEAVALGAIAGGCNFIGAYPMSPSTGVFAYLAQHAGEFGIIAEQVEDEISAINMGIGAWYAGARALVSTAGGGFALMTEGLSLAGITESPLVVHIAQRPGPATGLPTRTEQGDLLLALYAGHGEFPRAIFAPGTLADAYTLTQKAFNLADETQCPVFVLTDQLFVDSYHNTPDLGEPDFGVNHRVVRTNRDYQRYEITDDGISPRGIPGFGEGIVVVDSDEHDEDGHITESMEVRVQMVDKRLRKLNLLLAEAIPPELIGPENYETLVVAWGSNYHVVREALKVLDRDDVAGLYFRQVYPLHPDTAVYLKRARQTVTVENNATGQFASVIKQHAGIEIAEKVLKYDGMPFSVEGLVDQLGKLCDGSQ
jgi:2-oxoglutarate ferredoxin oxidoreductase subunit alpha